MAAAIRLSQQHSCYLETESEVSCGSPDFDLITEVSDAVCEPGCGFGRVATGEVFGAEVLVVSAVTQHMVDRRQDRRGHRDGRLNGGRTKPRHLLQPLDNVRKGRKRGLNAGVEGCDAVLQLLNRP